MATLGCTPAQRADPEASEKRYLLGADLFGKRQYRPALEELLQAVALNPENADAHYLLGLLALEQASESESMIETATCPSGEEQRLLRGDAEVQFHKAEEAFHRAVVARPDMSEAWNSLAVVDLHFQRWDAAIEAAEKALTNALYRQPWAAQANLAWAYYQKKEYLRATKELRTAMFSNPKFCVGRYRLARVLLEQQDLAGAQAELDRLTTEKTCPIQEAFHLLGVVSLRRGDPAGRAAATEAFRRCVELAPQSCLARECRIVN